MFTAWGRGAKKNADGTFAVRVEIVDDRTTKSVKFENYSGSLTSIKAAIMRDLNQLKDNENDVTLNEAVVGKILGSV